VTIHANGNETLTVKNNRQPRVIHEVSHKIGLQNIRQRYELVSGRKVEVQQTANYFEVVLPLLHINSVA
jgi:sensor histidine kinase YesM